MLLSYCSSNLRGIVGFQSIVGVAGGATRAALTQHQARRDNMADVSAKDGSQVSSFLIQGFLYHLNNTRRNPCLWNAFISKNHPLKMPEFFSLALEYVLISVCLALEAKLLCCISRFSLTIYVQCQCTIGFIV